MKVVVASTQAQADLAMRELRIGPREWRLARDVRDLQGVSAADVIDVEPWLDVMDEKRHEMNVEIGRMERRDAVSVRVVRT